MRILYQKVLELGKFVRVSWLFSHLSSLMNENFHLNEIVRVKVCTTSIEIGRVS